MPTAHEEARAVIAQMYSAIGLARHFKVPPIDVDGLLAWTTTLDACLTAIEAVTDVPADGQRWVRLSDYEAMRHALQQELQPRIVPLDVTSNVERDGWDCAWCGHRHAGRAFGYICIGCACEQRPAQPCVTQ